MANKHIHRYHKVSTGTGPIWACGLPDCTHFMPAHYTGLLIGKSSICWNCGNNMILTTEGMKTNQPVCFDCTNETELVSQLTSSRLPVNDTEDDELDAIPMKKKITLEDVINAKLTDS